MASCLNSIMQTSKTKHIKKSESIKNQSRNVRLRENKTLEIENGMFAKHQVAKQARKNSKSLFEDRIKNTNLRQIEILLEPDDIKRFVIQPQSTKAVSTFKGADAFDTSY